MKGSNTAEAEEVAASAAMLVFRAEVVTPMRELCESLEELRGSEPSGKIRSNTSADGKCRGGFIQSKCQSRKISFWSKTRTRVGKLFCKGSD